MNELSIAELMAQKEALEQQIRLARNKEKRQAQKKIKELVTDYGLTPCDLTYIGLAFKNGPTLSLQQVKAVVEAVETLQGVDTLHDHHGNVWTEDSRREYLKQIFEMV